MSQEHPAKKNIFMLRKLLPATGVIWALRFQKLEKESENEFLGPLSPRAQKVENGVEKESKSTVFQLF